MFIDLFSFKLFAIVGCLYDPVLPCGATRMKISD